MMQVNLCGMLKEADFSDKVHNNEWNRQDSFNSFKQFFSESREEMREDKQQVISYKQSIKTENYYKADYKSVGEKETSKKQTKEQDEEAEDEMLGMIAQFINMPLDEMKQYLEELGLEASDLREEEAFSHFVGEVLAGEGLNELLACDLEGASQLFEELKGLSEEGEEVINPISFTSGNETLVQGLGLTLPVHHFTNTYNTSFTSDGKITMDVIRTGDLGDGQAFIEQIDFKTIGEIREINMQLKPKELGELNIKIVEVNGVIVAEIKVDNEKTKDLITNDIELLKENLEEQGINVSEVKVDIRQNNRQSQMEQEREKSSKRIQEIISKYFTEEADDSEEVTLAHSDSEVDYMV